MSTTDKEKKSLTFNVRTLLEILRKDKRKMAVWTCSFGIFGIVVAPIGLSWIVRNLIRFALCP